MACGDKLDNTCGKKINARCVKFEGAIPEYSELSDDRCLNIHETTVDLYENQEEIKESIDVTELYSDCMDYPDDAEVKDILAVHGQKICDLSEGSGTAVNSTARGIDMSKINKMCLETMCGAEIRTPEELLNAIIKEICNCTDCGSTTTPGTTIPGTTTPGKTDSDYSIL